MGICKTLQSLPLMGGELHLIPTVPLNSFWGQPVDLIEPQSPCLKIWLTPALFLTRVL